MGANTHYINGHAFEAGCDLIDVTSMNRPDTAWRKVDAAGHVHCWHVNGAPATNYDPAKPYDVPTVEARIVGEYVHDGEVIKMTDTFCRQCGERVTPGTTADTYQRFIPGRRWFAVDGRSVTRAEFVEQLRVNGVEVPASLGVEP